MEMAKGLRYRRDSSGKVVGSNTAIRCFVSQVQTPERALNTIAA
jgi:hypothetical protein